jgi:hypothetical protein
MPHDTRPDLDRLELELIGDQSAISSGNMMQRRKVATL